MKVAAPARRGSRMDQSDRVWRERGLLDAALVGDERAWRAWYEESFPGLHAYALWRWRLWDVDIFAREAVATTAAVFLGAASFVLVNALLNRVLVGFASGAKNLLAFGSGLFLASLLVPVKRRFSSAIERAADQCREARGVGLEPTRACLQS